MAILTRRTLTRTREPILSNFSRIVPHVASEKIVDTAMFLETGDVAGQSSPIRENLRS